MIRRPPRSTLDRSSAASDVYKRQLFGICENLLTTAESWRWLAGRLLGLWGGVGVPLPVSYTHLRAHETVLDLVCRLLLEKKNTTDPHTSSYPIKP